MQDKTLSYNYSSLKVEQLDDAMIFFLSSLPKEPFQSLAEIYPRMEI